MHDALQSIDIEKADIKLAYTLEETAARLSVCPDTVRKWIRERKLRKLPMRNIRVSGVELNRFLSEGAR